MGGVLVERDGRRRAHARRTAAGRGPRRAHRRGPRAAGHRSVRRRVGPGFVHRTSHRHRHHPGPRVRAARSGWRPSPRCGRWPRPRRAGRPGGTRVGAWMDAHRRDVFSALYEIAAPSESDRSPRSSRSNRRRSRPRPTRSSAGRRLGCRRRSVATARCVRDPARRGNGRGAAPPPRGDHRAGWRWRRHATEPRSRPRASSRCTCRRPDAEVARDAAAPEHDDRLLHPAAVVGAPTSTTSCASNRCSFTQPVDARDVSVGTRAQGRRRSSTSRATRSAKRSGSARAGWCSTKCTSTTSPFFPSIAAAAWHRRCSNTC